MKTIADLLKSPFLSCRIQGEHTRIIAQVNGDFEVRVRKNKNNPQSHYMLVLVTNNEELAVTTFAKLENETINITEERIDDYPDWLG